jgi:hypothetical protein
MSKQRTASGTKPLWVAALFACALPGAGATAQEEQRWYEVEAIVFSHENRASQVTERPLADPTRLGWLPRVRELQPASASLAYPFEPVPLLSVQPDPALAQAEAIPAAMVPVAPDPVFGPLPAPRSVRGFRLADTARDPYIALSGNAVLLAQDAQRLAATSEHRVLWHAAWRQPMLPARQAQSVLVMGGDKYGERNEVEGSLRFTDSGGRVQLEAHLWFSSFLAGFASEGTAWTLPDLPLEAKPAVEGEDAALLGSWISSGAWQLRDTRLLTTDAFHYLDNPAIGVLVQVRSYAVPPLVVPGGDEDF